MIGIDGREIVIIPFSERCGIITIARAHDGGMASTAAARRQAIAMASATVMAARMVIGGRPAAPCRSLAPPHAHQYRPAAAQGPARRGPCRLMGPDGRPGTTAVRDADGWMRRLSEARADPTVAHLYRPPWHHTCSNLPKL
jgi:hypothetical protein